MRPQQFGTVSFVNEDTSWDLEGRPVTGPSTRTPTHVKYSKEITTTRSDYKKGNLVPLSRGPYRSSRVLSGGLRFSSDRRTCTTGNIEFCHPTTRPPTDPLEHLEVTGVGGGGCCLTTDNRRPPEVVDSTRLQT